MPPSQAEQPELRKESESGAVEAGSRSENERSRGYRVALLSRSDANGYGRTPPDKNEDRILKLQRVSMNMPAMAYPHRKHTAAATPVVIPKCVRTL
jgi:hypothetical protein